MPLVEQAYERKRRPGRTECAPKGCFIPIMFLKKKDPENDSLRILFLCLLDSFTSTKRESTVAVS